MGPAGYVNSGLCGSRRLRKQFTSSQKAQHPAVGGISILYQNINRGNCSGRVRDGGSSSSDTRDYERLREITRDYERLREITRDYERLREITRDYERLREITPDVTHTVVTAYLPQSDFASGHRSVQASARWCHLVDTTAGRTPDASGSSQLTRSPDLPGHVTPPAAVQTTRCQHHPRRNLAGKQHQTRRQGGGMFQLNSFTLIYF